MALAKISGVALAPGVSRNRRLYTPELIAKAAARMQERLADPNGLPIVMRTHHEAGDDSARIVGRVTAVSIGEDKSLRYKADLYNTSHGQDIAALVTGKAPALRSVSIHGYWVGDTKQVQTAEGLATSADDLEIDAIDFTASPGVDGALIDSGSSKATESGGVLRTPISEAMEANVTLSEEDSGWADITQETKEWTVTRGVQFEGDLTPYWVSEAKYSADDMKDMASKGQAMKNDNGDPSYPIKDVSDLKKAIKAVGRGGADHDAIRRHIIKRAKALGASDLIPDNWASDGSMKESEVRVGDVTEYYGDTSNVSGFCIDAYSGPLSVTIRGCVTPDQLRAAAQAAAVAAMNAINVMDPDDDADIDVGAEGEGPMEQGTAAVGGVIPDDNMLDNYGESAPQGDSAGEQTSQVTHYRRLEVSADFPELEQLRQTQEALNAKIDALLARAAERSADSAETQEMTMAPDADGHSHTHDLDGENHTHSHMHDHAMSENGGKPYSHSHTHAHVHASSDNESHQHGHNHVHVTSPSATAESSNTPDNEEESAMGETQNTAATEAAPTIALTADDLRLIIGESVAAALKAVAPEDNKNAKHAAPAQETTEQVAEESVAEAAPVEDGTPKAEDLTALKESLAKELRKEIRDELRNELLKENGLPPRRGYRLSENAEEEVQMTDAELFNNNRVDILLGGYGLKAPDAPASA
jgi:hypothetical protein